MPSVEILNLGDELLLGLRANSHLVYLGEILCRHQLGIRWASVIRDDHADLVAAVSLAWSRADLIITTGGLGPTTDDNTRQAVAQVLGVGLVRSEAAAAALAAFFARLNRVPTANNDRQAWLLDGAELIPNARGTAPGQWFEREGRILIMLPGPPNELIPMFEKEILPRLRARGLAPEVPPFIQIRTAGIGESSLETLLQPAFDRAGPGLSVAYCAHEGMVDVRLSSVSPLISQDCLRCLAKKCRELLGEDFVCYGQATLGEVVLARIRQLGRRLAVAESCTGGLIADAFCSVPGASASFVGSLVCYQNCAKTNAAGVPEVIIEQHGAVSAECAAALAVGAAEKLEADFALSVTGYAGPDGGTEKDPVGTVYVGWHSPCGIWGRRLTLTGSRDTVRQKATYAALDFARRKLTKYAVDDTLACCEPSA